MSEPETMNVAEELTDRFLGMYFHIQEGFEFRPGYVLTDEEYAAAKLFERLHDDVDAIPANVIAAAETLVAKVEASVFESHMQNALKAVGRTSFPNTAAKFLLSLNYAIALDVPV